jgi:hypothetical protein
MECRGFDNVVLLEYAMGRLDEAENRRVRLHLAHCDDCRSVVAELNPLAAMMTAAGRTLRHDLPPPRAEVVIAAGRRDLTGAAVRPSVEPAAGPAASEVAAPAARNLPAPAARSTPRAGVWARPAKPLAFAAAAAIAVAVFLKLRTPGDPWEALDKQLAGATKPADLKDALTRVTGYELARETVDYAAVVDLEFAAWIARNVADTGQLEYIRRLTARRRPASTVAPATPGSAGFDWGATPAYASVSEGDVRSRLAAGKFDEVQNLLAGKSVADDLVVIRAFAARAASTPKWGAAAVDLQHLNAAGPLAAAARVLGALYLWEDGDRGEALSRLARAGATDPRAWLRAAYIYRWGLNNEMKARSALLHVPDESLLEEELKTSAFAGLPTMYIQDEFDFPDLDADDNWWRSPRSYILPTGSEGALVAVPTYQLEDENGERLLRHMHLTAKPAVLLSRYPATARDYTLQFDLRFDELDPTAGADPYLNVLLAYNQSAYCYRLLLRPGAVQFSKRRPPLPQQAGAAAAPAAAPALAEHNGDHLEFLLPEGSPPRLAQSMPVGRWYTLKVRVESAEVPDSAGRSRSATKLSAKVWPRLEREPDAWHLVQTDAGTGDIQPYSTGDFGLSAHGAKMSFDNALLAVRP